MEISINPLEWMTDKERQKNELHTKVVETFNAYRKALADASIPASDTKIFRKVAEIFGMSENGVRMICKSRGVELRTRGQKAAAV